MLQRRTKALAINSVGQNDVSDHWRGVTLWPVARTSDRHGEFVVGLIRRWLEARLHPAPTARLDSHHHPALRDTV